MLNSLYAELSLKLNILICDDLVIADIFCQRKMSGIVEIGKEVLEKAG